MITFLQLLISGLALGAMYSLIALGITIILQAGILNFAQGGFMLVGAYLVSWLAIEQGWNFFLALIASLAATVIFGMAFDRFILSRLNNQNQFSVLMITFGLNIICEIFVQATVGTDLRSNGDPWGKAGFNIGELRFNLNDLLAIGITGILLVIFFIFFKISKQGIAMRAVALDFEAAAAVGINVWRVNSITWGISVAVTTIAGVFLAGFPHSLEPGLGNAAFKALPALVLGGLGSTTGAVAGSLIIGLTEVLVAGYGETVNKFIPIGSGVQAVAPYIVLLIVLLVRPQGLFGRKGVERV